MKQVSILVPDDFVFVDGKAELLKFLNVRDVSPANLNSDEVNIQTSLQAISHVFRKLQKQTFIDIDAKSMTEANTGIDKIEITYEEMIRRSTDSYGFICWLKDNYVDTDSGMSSFRIPDVRAIVYGDELLGGNSAQRMRCSKGAAEIFKAKSNILDAIAAREFCITDATVFAETFFAETAIYRHELEYFQSLGTEAEIIEHAALKAIEAPVWGCGFIYPEIEVSEEYREHQAQAIAKFASQKQISDMFIAALCKKGQMLEFRADNSLVEQVSRPGMSVPVPAEIDWSASTFEGNPFIFTLRFDGWIHSLFLYKVSQPKLEPLRRKQRRKIESKRKWQGRNSPKGICCLISKRDTHVRCCEHFSNH
jgi:hypothetical protein